MVDEVVAIIGGIGGAQGVAVRDRVVELALLCPVGGPI